MIWMERPIRRNTNNGIINDGIPVVHRVIVVLCVLHLLFVLMSSVKIQPFTKGASLRRLLDTYGGYSGAGNSYGFFAPGVLSDRRAVVHVYLPSIQAWRTVLEQGGNNETSLAISTASNLLAREELRDLVAASWAARVIRHHTEASASIVEVQAYLIPTVRDYQKGARPDWITTHLLPFATVPVR